MESSCQGFSLSHPEEETLYDRALEGEQTRSGAADGGAGVVVHTHPTHNITFQQPPIQVHVQGATRAAADPLILVVKQWRWAIFSSQIVLFTLYALLFLPHFSRYRWVGFQMASRLVEDFVYYFFAASPLPEGPQGAFLQAFDAETHRVTVRTNRRAIFALLLVVRGAFVGQTAMFALLQWLVPVPSSAIFSPEVVGWVSALRAFHVVVALSKNYSREKDAFYVAQAVLVQFLLWYSL